tara:strand:- start:126 stop:521 length:396 start_codon:yes stop_codon:yes gene_type:complete
VCTACSWLVALQVFYPTHQFFITPCSIYIVVFDLRKQEWKPVTYWMRQIKASTGLSSPPIIFVGTHVDAINATEQSLEETTDFIMKTYRTLGKIVGVRYVSCKGRLGKAGISELKNLLVVCGLAISCDIRE